MLSPATAISSSLWVGEIERQLPSLEASGEILPCRKIHSTDCLVFISRGSSAPKNYYYRAA